MSLARARAAALKRLSGIVCWSQIICARLKLLALPPPRGGDDGFAPNVLGGAWVSAPDRARLWPRLRCGFWAGRGAGRVWRMRLALAAVPSLAVLAPRLARPAVCSEATLYVP